MSTQPIDRLVPLRELPAILDVSADTVARRRKLGIIPPPDVDHGLKGKMWRASTLIAHGYVVPGVVSQSAHA